MPDYARRSRRRWATVTTAAATVALVMSASSWAFFGPPPNPAPYQNNYPGLCPAWQPGQPLTAASLTAFRKQWSATHNGTKLAGVQKVINAYSDKARLMLFWYDRQGKFNTSFYDIVNECPLPAGQDYSPGGPYVPGYGVLPRS